MSDRPAFTANPQVDGYIRKNKDWADVLQALRKILLAQPLTEEMKWRMPVYTLDGANVAGIAALKDHCVISFFKGALLKDPKGVLQKPGENSRSARVVRFTAVAEVDALAAVLKKCIGEAIAVEKAGLKVDMAASAEVAVPDEIQARLDKDPALKKAFNALTPGRRRGYLLHFGSAKQPQTRITRLEKYAPAILEGKGMHD